VAAGYAPAGRAKILAAFSNVNYEGLIAFGCITLIKD
jgi:hypothetical protein